MSRSYVDWLSLQADCTIESSPIRFNLCEGKKFLAPERKRTSQYEFHIQKLQKKIEMEFSLSHHELQCSLSDSIISSNQLVHNVCKLVTADNAFIDARFNYETE